MYSCFQSFSSCVSSISMMFEVSNFAMRAELPNRVSNASREAIGLVLFQSSSHKNNVATN